MCTKILLLCVLAAELPARVLSISQWDEETLESNLVFDREESMDRPSLFFSGKHPGHQERLRDQVKRVAIPDSQSLQQRLITRPLCPCETGYEFRDLGEGCYPRYLTASYCKSKPCRGKFNSCHLLHYPVHILRQRDTSLVSEKRYKDDEFSSEIPLPESLRRKWQLLPMEIGVACVSTPDSDGN